MFLAGSNVNVGDTIAFEYVYGNDIPNETTVQGTLMEVKKTAGRLEYIHVLCNNGGMPNKHYWTHLIVDGSVNILSRKGA